MTLGIDTLDPIQSAIPDWQAIVVALLTQLGDVWFVVAVLLGLYWFHPSKRRQVATLAGVMLAGIGIYRGFKSLFAIPRPDQPLRDPETVSTMVQPLYEATATASGYGFPSGHATTSTILYFGLAGVLAVGSRRTRYAAAAALVAIVSATRVVLRVHYLQDVVAGVALGLTLLAGTHLVLSRVDTDEPAATFGLAILCSGFYLYTSAAEPDAVLLAGATLGAFIGWQATRIDGSRIRMTPFGRPVSSRALIAVLSLGAALLAIVTFTRVPALAASLVAGLFTAFAIGAPVVRPSSLESVVPS
ncbi:phosphatase PAP2 family protein [Natronosalvus rutilus]|uniref:Phosphatase PAP2 family protein n=1 Tax=Natronosalvus rutilus TaxID=2953753 RepID=A0A9E7N7I7_9EURY|nr:phosphatase PAP2 family protein [Natronosalvus rutilus]UTF53147.1 phosphatase PAP2 family protein [Natronosalvus rutilus]